MNKYILVALAITLSFSQYNKSSGSAFVGLNIFPDNYNINYTMLTSQKSEFVSRINYLVTSNEPFKVEDFNIHALFAYEVLNISDFYLLPAAGAVFSYSKASDILDNKIEEFVVAFSLGADFQYYITSNWAVSLDLSQLLYIKSKVHNYLFTSSIGIEFKL